MGAKTKAIDIIPNGERHRGIPNGVLEYVLGVVEYIEFADNVRIAEKGNPDSQTRYEKHKRIGCCGSADYILVPFLVDGKEYYFGYNYGH